jgi:deoxyribonuclease-4
MRVGAHVSTAGGVDKAVDRALDMGAEAVQVFTSAPQSWRRREFSAEEIAAFRARAQEVGLGPNYIHGPYLINLATPDPALLAKSVEALVLDLELCSRLGMEGVIFHLGSHKGAGLEERLGQIVDSILQVLARTPADTWLVLENSAGMGGAVGSHFPELGRIVRAAAHPRVKVCLDTQHMFAAGYDLCSRQGLEAAMEEFDREVGLERLVAVHANDSKCPLAGGIDRHENIGLGYIGREGFLNVLAHPAFRDLPFLLEVPGMDGGGPDRPNVEALKELRRLALGG